MVSYLVRNPVSVSAAPDLVRPASSGRACAGCTAGNPCPPCPARRGALESRRLRVLPSLLDQRQIPDGQTPRRRAAGARRADGDSHVRAGVDDGAGLPRPACLLCGGGLLVVV